LIAPRSKRFQQAAPAINEINGKRSERYDRGAISDYVWRA